MRVLSQFTVREDSSLKSMCFTGDDRLVCGLAEAPLVVVSLPEGAPVASLEGDVHDTTCLALSADGKRLVSGHGSWGGALVWDLERFRPLHVLDQSLMYVGAVRFAADGRVHVAKGPMGWVFSPSGELEVEPADDGLKPTPVALSFDGTSRAELSKRQVHLSVFPNGALRVVGDIPGDHTNRGVVRFSPDGSLIAAGDNAGNVRVWKCADGALVRSLDGKKSAIEGLEVSSERLVVLDSTGFDGRLRLVTDAGVTELKVNGNVLAVSPSGTLAAVGDDSGQVNLIALTSQ